MLEIDSDYFDSCQKVKDRFEHFSFVIKQATLNGYACEFGVYKGKTLRILDELWPATVFGFDCFKGLPEDWDTGTEPHPKGTFKCSIPTGFSDKVKIINGYFCDTIPIWKKENKACISFLHIDSDLYSSAKDILTGLNDRIVKDTVILFDELLNFNGGWYINYKDGELKALNEWIVEYDRKIEPISRSYRNQAAIKVIW